MQWKKEERKKKLIKKEKQETYTKYEEMVGKRWKKKQRK